LIFGGPRHRGVKALVYRMAQRIAARLYDGRRWAQEADELVAIAFEAAWKAACSFQPALGLRFTTYASTCIRNAFLRDRQYRAAIKFTAVTVVALEETNEPAWPERDEPEPPTQKQLEELLQLVNEGQRDILRAHYLDGMTFVAIAERLGVSKQAVWSTHQNAIRQLRMTARNVAAA
jgi:RNA polymerase sigma factor (sigma-70 family)